jgi:ATP-dependent protease ClpP protease subunit
MPNELKREFRIVARDKSAEIQLYSEIGGYYGGVSAKDFAKELKDAGDVENLTIRINSPGGDVFDGNTIYNILKAHKARKTVYVDGLAASIASVIAMAGDKIYMAENAMMMIHPAWALVIGNAEDLRASAGTLDKIDDSILRTYAKRTGMEDDKLREMLIAETWMNSEEALELGFVDEITDALEMAACFDPSKFRYRNTPEALLIPKASDETRMRLARMEMASRRIRSARAPS